MGTDIPVTVVGAGPYGLAVAAHLRGRGIPLRVFGEPMECWQYRMPAGMFLKSTPRASSICAPGHAWRLEHFRTAEGRPGGEDQHPVPVEEFIRYGRWFQRQCVPQLERTEVRGLVRRSGGFQVTLASGEEFGSRRVVLATGQTPYAHVPAALGALVDAGLASHPADHPDLSVFSGRRVAVLGAGQSALESAALLKEAGATPTLVARTGSLLFGDPPTTDNPSDRPLPERLVKPASNLGPGWSMLAFAKAPGAFRHLPTATRLQLVRTILGPSGAWWLRERVDGRVPTLTGHRLTAASVNGEGVRLELIGPRGPQLLDVDHVLSATGYRVDLDHQPLLAPELVRALARTGPGAPLLSAGFESSVPGLYFTGLSAAATFGPVLRFVCGTGFAARRISAAIAAD